MKKLIKTWPLTQGVVLQCFREEDGWGPGWAVWRRLGLCFFWFSFLLFSFSSKLWYHGLCFWGVFDWVFPLFFLFRYLEFKFSDIKVWTWQSNTLTCSGICCNMTAIFVEHLPIVILVFLVSEPSDSRFKNQQQDNWINKPLGLISFSLLVNRAVVVRTQFIGRDISLPWHLLLIHSFFGQHVKNKRTSWKQM